MSPKNAQTPDPEGQKQEEQPPSAPPEEKPEDLKKRLADMQATLAAKDKELAEKEKQFKSKDAEAKKLQAAADARARLLTTVQKTNQPAPLPGRVQPGAGQQSQTPGPTPMQELAEFANEQAKEATLLREVIARKLNLEDVEGLTFNSTEELRTQLDLLQQKKEIAELRARLEKGQEGAAGGEEPPGPPPPSGLRLDTGGRSVDEAQQQLNDLKTLRSKAGELKGQRRYQEATYIALRAARRDPEKATIVRPRDEE